MQAILPIEVYEAFEKILCRNEAKAVVKSIETVISEYSEQKWKTARHELIEEMKQNFVTKDELRASLAGAKDDIIKWVAAMLVAQAGVIAALVKLL